MSVQCIVTVSAKQRGLYRDKVWHVDDESCLVMARAVFFKTKGAYRVMVEPLRGVVAWVLDTRRSS